MNDPVFWLSMFLCVTWGLICAAVVRLERHGIAFWLGVVVGLIATATGAFVINTLCNIAFR